MIDKQLHFCARVMSKLIPDFAQKADIELYSELSYLYQNEWKRLNQINPEESKELLEAILSLCWTNSN